MQDPTGESAMEAGTGTATEVGSSALRAQVDTGAGPGAEATTENEPGARQADDGSALHAIPMRRCRQEMPREEVEGLLAGHGATSGVLALNDPESGVPYQVPLSYVYVPAADAAHAPTDKDAGGEDADSGSQPSPHETRRPQAYGTFYFHGSLAGHKTNLIRAAEQAGTNRASFCVTFADDVVAEEFATRYRSAIACGRIEVVANEEERHDALMRLGLAYAGDIPNASALTEQEIATCDARTCVTALRVETLVGKESKSLAAERHARQRDSESC